MGRCALRLATGVLCLLVAQALAAQERFGIEIVVRTGENLHSLADAQRLLASAQRHSVAVIDLLVKQDEDGAIASGAAYYRSALAPVAPGYERFDALQAVLDLARPMGIKVRAWMPQFHDQVAAKRHPRWQMVAKRAGRTAPYTGAASREYFVNPLDADVQDYERALIAEVTAGYPVDGIFLDWLRFDDYPMDLGRSTRERFRRLAGIDPLRIDFSRPSAARERWNAFRTDGIAAYVDSVRRSLKPGLSLGVFILPPDFVEVGQDAAKFNRAAGLLAPMCYSKDWRFPLAWIWENCLATTVAKAGDAEVVPTLDAGLDAAEHGQILARIRQDFPQIRRIAWFYHGEWTDERLSRLAAISGR